MNDSVLLQADKVGKSWSTASNARERFVAMVRLLFGLPVRRNATLSDVSLKIARGESMGIIGSNGAGKSTLLKLLTGVLHPTDGQITRNCRIGALLELGAGFEYERTGRENIYIYAALHGISRSVIQSEIETITTFADIGDYIDQPIKHYSSGMVVRLAFALIVATRPDLLITDEILAVGDESFQKMHSMD